MINMLIVLVLFIGAYSGYKKGLVLKLLQAIGYTFAFIIALQYYLQLSEFLFLLIPYPTPFAPEVNPYLFYNEQFIFSMDMSYYHILSLLALFFIGWSVVKFLTTLVSFTLEKVHVPEPVSGIGGGITGFLINYIGLFLVLFFLSTIPIDRIQTTLYESSFSNRIITSTPQLSNSMYERFIVAVNQKDESDTSPMDIQSENEPATESNEE